MRVLVTGGSGVLGRATVPRLRAAGHDVLAPEHRDLDLFDPHALADALTHVDAMMHLATRIPSPARMAEPDAWSENDRLRTETPRLLVDAAMAMGVTIYVQPTVAFVYPPDGPADEDTPVDDASPRLRSVFTAERETMRFAAAGGRGVVLRLGLLDGPGTGNDVPNARYDATLHAEDAGAALVAALAVPSGIYNVVRDGERIANRRFRQASGWAPAR